MAMDPSPQCAQPEPSSGQTHIACTNAPSPGGRCGHRLRVVGVTCTIAFTALWIFSLFYHVGVVRQWPDGFAAIGIARGSCGMLGKHIPSECWPLDVNAREAKRDAELSRAEIKMEGEFFRSVFAGHSRIGGHWSFDCVCDEWLPSYKSLDETDSAVIHLRTTRINLPLWLPMSLIAVPTLWSYWRCRVRERRGHCGKCRYDLTGNVSGICPECGTPIPEQVRLEIEAGCSRFSELGG
jgi:hypothetical protein